MPTREKSCGAIVYHERDGARKYLLVQQKYSRNWGFAKGHVEKGEDERATAMREVAEETGLAVDLDPEFRTQAVFYDRARNSKLVVLFLEGVDARRHPRRRCGRGLMALVRRCAQTIALQEHTIDPRARRATALQDCDRRYGHGRGRSTYRNASIDRDLFSEIVISPARIAQDGIRARFFRSADALAAAVGTHDLVERLVARETILAIRA